MMRSISAPSGVGPKGGPRGAVRPAGLGSRGELGRYGLLAVRRFPESAARASTIMHAKIFDDGD